MDGITFETFAEIGSYEQRNLTQDNPSCFNNRLRIRKYKISVELIDEPIEIIQARIQALWDENKKNHHYVPLLLRAAKDYDVKLDNE